MSLRKLLEEEVKKLHEKTGDPIKISMNIWMHRNNEAPKTTFQTAIVGCFDVDQNEFNSFGELLKYVKNYGRDEILFRNFGGK